jgi:hypothetical protein
MMPPVVILAHGALGPFDEVIFISVIIIFLTMMGISWIRSRGVEDEDTDGKVTTEEGGRVSLE